MPGYYVMRFGRTPDSLIGNAAGLKAPVYTQVRVSTAPKWCTRMHLSFSLQCQCS
jgi:hypothetical protein